MEDIKEKKREVRDNIVRTLQKLSDKERKEQSRQLEARLFEFANYIEANIVLLYIPRNVEFDPINIIKKSLANNKIVVLPAFSPDDHEITLMKIDNYKSDLIQGPLGCLEPDPERCKKVPIECIDIAFIPGLAFDEKGGRVGTGQGYYDRIIPQLPATTRKVAIAFEKQIVLQVPMESHDRYVDIIITDQRVIYKI